MVRKFENVSLDKHNSLVKLEQVPDTDRVINKRKSSRHLTLACCSCQKRRKKCDGGYPSCSGCIKQNIDCTIIFHPTGREIKRNHIESLEKEIDSLKALLGNTNRSDSVAMSSDSSCSYTSNSPDLEIQTKLFNDQKPRGYSITKMINTSLNVYATDKSSTDSGHYRLNRFNTPFKFPSIEIANNLLKVYKISVHTQYPFLDWTFVESCFKSVIIDRSNDKTESFFIFMILAIASQLSLSSNSRINYTRSYYEMAFNNLSPIIEHLNLQTVQAYLLLAMFAQKVSDGNAVWQTTGLAIRSAVILGLHRTPYKSNKMIESDDELNDLKSRIFWSAYGIERINGLVLGRPFGISDIDIDMPYPVETDESRVACHVFKLRSIQSNICSFIYNPLRFKDEESNDSTKVGILIELNDWMSTFPGKEDTSSFFETNNWSLVSYHNSILLLLRPTIVGIAKNKLNSSKRDFEWFKIFTESASAICTSYKSSHLKGILDYTWLAMHCCFVAGISFLYCIWMDKSLNVLQWKRKSIIYETINSCSSLLYVFAEKWESAAVFRDSFERISNLIKNQIDKNNIDTNDPTVGLLNGIEIDPYLRMSNEFFNNAIDPFKTNNNQGPSNVNEVDDSSLWEFLDSTGDVYLRNLFNEMEGKLQ